MILDVGAFDHMHIMKFAQYKREIYYCYYYYYYHYYQEDKLQHHLTSQGYTFFFSNVIKYSLSSVNSI